MIVERIKGFDLARAYAIFGMFVVNFNFSFGSFQDNTLLGRFVNLFTGNSTAIFILCAGMGLTFMARKSKLSAQEVKSIILRRSWFLFACGLLLYAWWPGDILHFYGGYMHIAAFILFLRPKYYLVLSLGVLITYHILLMFFPVEQAWDFLTFQYADFWSLKGFLRNTLYNGWNSIFPWMAYFLLGMWLGTLDWNNTTIRKRLFVVAMIVFILMEGLRWYTKSYILDANIKLYIMSEYFPPYLPFMLITSSFALMVIVLCITVGSSYKESKIIDVLSSVGRMTLSNYVQHITIGMLILQWISHISYTGLVQSADHLPPPYILIYAFIYFLWSVGISYLITQKFGQGPLEYLMRRWSK